MPARILIIEDNPVNMELMSYLLSAFHYEVITAEDGEEGTDLIEREKPDLILCDIHLPGIDGYEVARRLKNHPMPAFRNIPLLAVTALAMAGDREKVGAAGFDGYIPKPIVPETFVQQIEAYLPQALRIAPPPTEGAPAKRQEAGPNRGSRVLRKHALLLVVDDREIELRLMHSVFDPSGFEVMTATNIDDALTFARRVPPDMIVCDVKMPEGSGYDLAEAVKADPQLRRIPVILITSVALAASDERRGMECGAVRYLTRPIEPQTLLSEIETCLEESRD